MESLLSRYRNITVLLVVIFGQIILLAWQVKSDSDVPLVRVWAVSAVAPVASLIENTRNVTTGFFGNYFELRNAREQSHQLRNEIDHFRLENQFLKNELASAQRAEQLAGFQKHSPSRMIGARVIGSTPGANTRSVLIDRGSQSGVRRGMAVVTPDGIVGRVLAVFPFASQVISVTDPGFAAGVESQKNHVHGVLKGLGNSARVDFVPTGVKVDQGEVFFTSGEDRVFPKGLAVGTVTSVKEGANFQDIIVQPAGTESAPEEVLVIVDPVHQAIPEAPQADSPVFLAPDVKPDDTAITNGIAGQPTTTAGKLEEQYKKIGDAQKHVFGDGLPGSLPPNFNLKVPGVNAPALPPGTPAPTGVQTTKPPVPPGATAPRPAGTTGASAPATGVPVARPSAGATGATVSTPRPAVAAGATGTTSPVRPPAPKPLAPKPITPSDIPGQE
jgi:rod shape-determining protein MreC